MSRFKFWIPEFKCWLRLYIWFLIYIVIFPRASPLLRALKADSIVSAPWTHQKDYEKHNFFARWSQCTCPEVCEGNYVQFSGSRVAEMPARTCGVTASQVAFQKRWPHSSPLQIPTITKVNLRRVLIPSPNEFEEHRPRASYSSHNMSLTMWEIPSAQPTTDFWTSVPFSLWRDYTPVSPPPWILNKLLFSQFLCFLPSLHYFPPCISPEVM